MKVRKVIELEVPGLGDRVRQARVADNRSLAEICRQIPMTTMNWYRISAEETKALLSCDVKTDRGSARR